MSGLGSDVRCTTALPQESGPSVISLYRSSARKRKSIRDLAMLQECRKRTQPETYRAVTGSIEQVAPILPESGSQFLGGFKMATTPA
jgi:hypothetical protein